MARSETTRSLNCSESGATAATMPRLVPLAQIMLWAGWYKWSRITSMNRSHSPNYSSVANTHLIKPIDTLSGVVHNTSPCKTPPLVETSCLSEIDTSHREYKHTLWYLHSITVLVQEKNKQQNPLSFFPVCFFFFFFNNDHWYNLIFNTTLLQNPQAHIKKRTKCFRTFEN